MSGTTGGEGQNGGRRSRMRVLLGIGALLLGGAGEHVRTKIASPQESVAHFEDMVTPTKIVLLERDVMTHRLELAEHRQNYTRILDKLETLEKVIERLEKRIPRISSEPRVNQTERQGG